MHEGAVKPLHFQSEGWFAGGKPSRYATASNELKIRSARPSGGVYVAEERSF
jgi:hypothetical protein